MANDHPITRVRLIFADHGAFHAETLVVSVERLNDYDRLIDLLREDPSISRLVYIDLKRLVSAYVIDEDG